MSRRIFGDLPSHFPYEMRVLGVPKKDWGVKMDGSKMKFHFGKVYFQVLCRFQGVYNS